MSFEDQDSADWGDHPNEPDYTDTLIWVHPTTQPAYDTSFCPPKKVAEEMVAGR